MSSATASRFRHPLLVLLRHGKAEAHAATDGERALTETGWLQARESARQFGAWMRQNGLHPDQFVVCCSTYRRARETAQPLLEQLAQECLLELEGILPESDPRAAMAILEQVTQDHPGRFPIVVSHMPFLADLCALLEQGQTGGAEPFNLAELRVLEAPYVAPGCAERIKRLPDF